jgi:beta-lactam-binding protein with PASTA domain
VTEEFSETVAKDLVIRQDPAPDTQAKRDTPVSVVISKGRQPIPVPNVVTKPAADAQKALEALGLTVVRGEPVNSETVPEGAVVSQTPATGTLFKGDTVTIVVSKGPVLIPVPDVTLKSVSEATKILQNAGLQVKVSKVFGGVLKTVRFQDPAAGTMVRRGTTITLTVI